MRWPRRSKASSGTIRISGKTSGASGFGSRMPQTPDASGCAEGIGAHDQRLARARRSTGSASCAPASASLRISGSGLISLLSGDEARDDRARPHRRSETARAAIACGRCGAHRRPAAHRGARALRGADVGFDICDGAGVVIHRNVTEKSKCGAAMAVGASIPGTYISRWAPYDRAHGPGQGQLP